MRMGFDRQIFAREDRREIGLSSTPALALVDRELIRAEAFLAEAVEILGLGKPGFRPGLNEGAKKRIGRAPVGDAQRSFAAVKIVAAIFVMLGTLEVGQHVGERPAGK